jgi:UPF0716 protein FxsA
MPFSLVPFLLLVIPVLEIVVFILVGREIGVLPTLGLILLTAFLGTILLRYQGFAVIGRIRSEIDRKRIPGRALGDGAMILVAGVLLLTPGFVTDSIGFALFVPAVRRALWRFIASRVSAIDLSSRRAGPDQFAGGERRRDDKVVDLDPDDFSERDDHTPWKKP